MLKETQYYQWLTFHRENMGIYAEIYVVVRHPRLHTKTPLEILQVDKINHSYSDFYFSVYKCQFACCSDFFVVSFRIFLND